MTVFVVVVVVVRRESIITYVRMNATRTGKQQEQ